MRVHLDIKFYLLGTLFSSLWCLVCQFWVIKLIQLIYLYSWIYIHSKTVYYLFVLLLWLNNLVNIPSWKNFLFLFMFTENIGHYGEQGMVSGAEGNWLHCIQSGSRMLNAQLTFSFLIQLGSPLPMVSIPYVRVDLPASVVSLHNPLQIFPDIYVYGDPKSYLLTTKRNHHTHWNQIINPGKLILSFW